MASDLQPSMCEKMRGVPGSRRGSWKVNALTSTFQPRVDVHTRPPEVDAMLQLPSAVALVETETSVHPEDTPVQLPASQH